jgi:phage-related holin
LGFIPGKVTIESSWLRTRNSVFYKHEIAHPPLSQADSRVQQHNYIEQTALRNFAIAAELININLIKSRVGMPHPRSPLFFITTMKKATAGAVSTEL